MPSDCEKKVTESLAKPFPFPGIRSFNSCWVSRKKLLSRASAFEITSSVTLIFVSGAGIGGQQRCSKFAWARKRRLRQKLLSVSRDLHCKRRRDLLGGF